MFEELENFLDLQTLANEWRTIRDEFINISASSFLDWPEQIYSGTWQVFPFYKFNQRIDSYCRVCPATTALIDQLPGLCTAAFSKMRTNTHIKPHRGYTDEVLRFHLGLVGGGQDCGIRVGNTTSHWHPGSAFIFDDTQEHEAWNRSGSDRTILLLDIKRNPAA